MGLGLWSIVAILYQTFFCVIISWLTLSCRLAPSSEELHEVTLMKLLYLYDPESCGRLHFYNYTSKDANTNRLVMAVVWPVSNDVAAGFRRKIQLWLALHLMWALLGVLYVTQERRSCALYATLLPFTLTGVVLMGTDLVFTIMFLMNVKNTASEIGILRHINSSRGSLRSINPTITVLSEDDTSWISLLFAYTSARGVVQWVLNFWIIKDSYYEGLDKYHRLQYQNTKDKLHSNTSQYAHSVDV